MSNCPYDHAPQECDFVCKHCGAYIVRVAPAESVSPAPQPSALSINGIAGDPIWAMLDGPDAHPIGLRLDCGDAGTAYFSLEQAEDVIDSLRKMIEASKPSESVTQLYKCLFCGHEQGSNEGNCTPAICGAYAWQPVAAPQEVKRWELENCGDGYNHDRIMSENPDGDYVLHSEYVSLREEHDKSEKYWAAEVLLLTDELADMRKALQKYANRIDWFEVESTSDGDKYQAFACPGKYGYEIAEKALEELSEVKP